MFEFQALGGMDGGDGHAFNVAACAKCFQHGQAGLSVIRERGVLPSAVSFDAVAHVVNMCKAWDDHKKLGIQEGMKQGIQQGMKQGRCLEVYSLVQDGILDPEVGASRVSMSLDDFADAMQKSGYKLPEMV